MERWVPLIGYPGYSVSDQGQVKNDRTDRIIKPALHENYRPVIGLVKDGTQVKRSVSKLVADAFLPPHAISSFTTAIHFDGDLWNCRVDNMDWRPRWFAVKHAIQFRREILNYPAAVREVKTGEVFDSAWSATLKYGLLYMDVVLSIPNKTYVFPTMQIFEWM